MVSLPCSRSRSTRYCNRLHDFSVAIPTCYNNICSNISFSHTDRHWNSLPAKCFSLIYDLNGLKSRVNSRHLFISGFFLNSFPLSFSSLSSSFSCNFMPYSGCSYVHTCMEWFWIKKKKKERIFWKNLRFSLFLGKLQAAGVLKYLIPVYYADGFLWKFLNSKSLEHLPVLHS